MGYHFDVQKALTDLLQEALPNIPILNGLAIEEAEASRLARAVFIVREALEMDPHIEINPNTAVQDQLERWTWILYVTGGGGSARAADRGAQVDETLEKIRTALNSQRLTADCGPLSIVSETFLGVHGTGVLYAQRWTHIRLE